MDRAQLEQLEAKITGDLNNAENDARQRPAGSIGTGDALIIFARVLIKLVFTLAKLG